MELKRNSKWKRMKQGISLVEVLLAIALFTLAVASLGVMGLSGPLLAEDSIERYRAILLEKEGVAALQAMRATDISSLTIGIHGLSFVAGKWQLTASPDVTERFTRTVTIASAGAGRLLARVVVSWTERTGSAGFVSASTFINQLYGSLWIQTTEADFSSGKTNGTEVGSYGDGVINLESHGDWTKPNEFANVNISDTGTVSAMAEADGMLYLASAGATSKPLVAISLQDAGRGNLPILKSVDVGATVNAIVVSGNYLYLGTNGDASELIVLRRSDLSVVRTLDLAGTADTLSLVATGTTLYLGRGVSTSPEIYQLDISNPESGIVTVRSVQFAGGVTKMALAPLYLFVGTTADASEFDVLRRTDLGIANTLNLSGSADVSAMLLSGNTLFLGRSNSSAQEIIMINVSNPLSPLSASGGADTGTAIRGLSLGADGVLYVATALASSEVMAYSPSSLSLIKAYNVTQGAGASGVLAIGPYVYVGLQNNNPELVLLRGGRGQWNNPAVVGTFDNPGSADGRSLLVRGTLGYLGTQTNGSGPEFKVVDVSNPQALSLVGTLEVNADVNSIVVIGPYAYCATSDNNRELLIINIADSHSPFIAGSYNTTGNIDALSITASGTMLAMGTGNNNTSGARELYLFDVSLPTTPVLRASAEVGDAVNGMTFTPAGYLALATANDAKELDVFDPRTPGVLSEVASYNTTGGVDAAAIASNSGGIILGTGNNGTNPDLYTFTQNTGNGTVAVAGFLDLNANNKSIAIMNGLAFVGNDLSGNGLATLDVNNIAAPLLLSNLPFASTVNSVSADPTFVYFASIDNNREMAIAGPTPLPSELAREGWFVSSAFDAGSPTPVWGTLSFTATGTGSTSFQFRVASTEAGLESAFWTGTGGIRGSTYATSGLPLTPDPLSSGLEWIQYRLRESGNGSTTPFLEDVRVTYN